MAYFFAGVDTGAVPSSLRHQRAMLELTRSFVAIANCKHQEALCSLARMLAKVTVGFEQSADAFD